MIKHQKYERWGIVSLEDVFKEKGEAAIFLGQPVHLKSLRIRTFFKKGIICSSCGLIASYFAIERGRVKDPAKRKDTRYHLNLYGINKDGNEILFTHDHTIPRIQGGKDDLSNTTTMCCVCNSAKSILENPNYKINKTNKK